MTAKQPNATTKLKQWPFCAPADLADRKGVRGKCCGENYGDIECPFCDSVLCNDGHALKLGDQCKKCHAKVVRFEET